ncbi:xanthine/uracil permease [Collybia nuda]|uniref:Xanthine/uracil permease n=1 Tax=Collybia nuda TaxID=64659 RepID=A0A9P5YE79_9AGAR|nr:xanthine/uracil permease [Collybia nuda]
MINALNLVERVNDAVADSFVGRWFKLDGSGVPKERTGSRFTTEIRAGITTWASMAYIISVNAAILADSGGTCVCPTKDLCLTDDVYLRCVTEVRQDLITSTAATAALASFLMGLLANLPVALAPGLGLNAYFAYSVVGFHGSGIVTYGEALSAVFLEGWIFLVLSLLGLRQWLVRIMPQSLVVAVGAGIGLFVAFIGLSPSGLGVVGGSTATLVTLGGCKPENFVSDDLPFYCASGPLQSPTMWLGIFCGGIFTTLLMLYRVRGAILIGIFLTSIISWPRPTPVTYFPHTPVGDDLFNYFKQVVTFHKLDKIGNAIQFNYGNGHVWYALITFLYVDILGTYLKHTFISLRLISIDNQIRLGMIPPIPVDPTHFFLFNRTLYSMARFAGLRDPVTLDFEGSTVAYCVDAFTISMGALMGTSPVTAFIESATGISEGGKTGLTGMAAGFAFFISVFFAPIFASIPSWATGGALVIVGSLMIRSVRDIKWDYMGDAVPAFLTIIIIPLTYNIAYGVIAGVMSYVLINGIPLILRKLSNGRIIPPNYYEDSEEWVIPPGSILPYWIRRLLGRTTNEDTQSAGDKDSPSSLSNSLESRHDGENKVPNPAMEPVILEKDGERPGPPS